MGALTKPSLMTVEEFDRIPDPPGARLELRHGVTYLVTYPRRNHIDLQDRLRDLLRAAFPEATVRIEMPFRPAPQHELWAADVGVVSRERWAATTDAGWLTGSPDLVVEVVSPSNTAEEMHDRERTCLEGGAGAFWVVYPKTRTVAVTARDAAYTYRIGQQIPAGNGFIDVGEIFAVLD